MGQTYVVLHIPKKKWGNALPFCTEMGQTCSALHSYPKIGLIAEGDLDELKGKLNKKTRSRLPKTQLPAVGAVACHKRSCLPLAQSLAISAAAFR